MACGGEASETAATGDPSAAVPTPSAGADTLDPRVTAADEARILGSETAPLWMIEISDFECPFCRNWHVETFPDLKREYIDTGKIRFAYINLPLRQHRHARPAAEHAMCAGAQGRFFEYAAEVFATQEEWTPMEDATELFRGLSARAGVDQAALTACVESGVMRPLVEADYQRALDSGAQSTPTFILGDQRLQGSQNMERLRAAIDAALAAAPAAAPASATP